MQQQDCKERILTVASGSALSSIHREKQMIDFLSCFFCEGAKIILCKALFIWMYRLQISFYNA